MSDEIKNENEKLVFVDITDEDKVVHRFQLLTLFNAGNLNRKYGAFLTQDIMLYRYYISDGRECGEEISVTDYDAINAYWQGVYENLDANKIKEGTIYLMDSEVGQIVPCEGTILSVFTTPFAGEIVAFIPHTIHFYRYYEKELENGDYEISWESILNPNEYEDVLAEFDKYIE